MLEESVKKRFKRAIISAERILSTPIGNARTIRLESEVFNIESIRKKEIRKIRIVLGKINEVDRKLVKDFELPEICTKEIWSRKPNGGFEIETIDN